MAPGSGGSRAGAAQALRRQIRASKLRCHASVALVGMSHSRPRPTACQLMLDAMPTVKRLVDQIRVHDKNLADQVKRAATSVVLNHAEADGVRSGQRRARIETAQGSLAETRAGLRVAAVWAYIPEAEAEQVDAMLDAVAAATYRRLHPRR